MIKLSTSAGVTTASVQTNLTKEIVKVVKNYKKEAFKLYNEDKKLIFAVGVGTQSFDGTVLNLEFVNGKAVYRQILVNPTKEEKDEVKVEMVAIDKKLKIVEAQVLKAYEEYNAAVASVEEVNLDEEPTVEVEEETEE